MFTNGDASTPGTGGSEQTAVTFTQAMLDTIGTALNTACSFGGILPQSNVFDSKKQEIAQAIKSNATAANITSITPSQKTITIVTSLKLTDNTTGVTSINTIGSAGTLKAVISNSNTITISCSNNGDLYTASSNPSAK